MKAVVFHGVGDIRLDDVKEPKLKEDTDAIVRLTASAICGTDLHMVRGTLPGMKPGTILGHEGVGVVEEVGKNVRNLRTGDRVVIPSTIACGSCSYCRAGYYSQCDNANPNGPQAGTAFFGGPALTGPFHGLLLESSERINSTLDLDELMVRIAEVVKRAVDYELFAILLLNEKAQELRVRFSIGHPDEIVRDLRIKVGEAKLPLPLPRARYHEPLEFT